MQNFTNIQDKLYSFNIHDDQSWALAKSPSITASQFSLLTSAKSAVRALLECLSEHL